MVHHNLYGTATYIASTKGSQKVNVIEREEGPNALVDKWTMRTYKPSHFVRSCDAPYSLRNSNDVHQPFHLWNVGSADLYVGVGLPECFVI